MGFNLASPWRQIKATKFGGLFTDVDPRGLPMGGSPLCYDCDFFIGGITIRPGLTPETAFPSIPGGRSFLWMGSFNLLGGAEATLFEDSGGVLWQELLAAEGTASQIYSGILNDARAIGEKVNQRAYITLSNLVAGSDQPRQWDGANLDRISQVGPGQAPLPPILGDTGGAIEVVYQGDVTHNIYNAIWGATLTASSSIPAGNYIFVLFAPSTTGNLNGLQPGDSVYLAGLPLMGGSSTVLGQDPNGTYKVVSVGVWNGSGAGAQEWFAVQSENSQGAETASGLSGATYQLAESVLCVAPGAIFPLATAQAAASMILIQSGIAQANTTFPVLRQPSVGLLTIRNTAMSGGVATYTYSLNSGFAPGWQALFSYLTLNTQIVDQYGHTWRVSVAGQSGSSAPSWPSGPTPGTTIGDGGVTWAYLPNVAVPVTVRNCSNGSGVFNVSQAQITSANATTFTVVIAAADVASAAESGGAATSGQGSTFVLDIGATTIGTGSPGQNPILGSITQGVSVPVVPTSATGANSLQSQITQLQSVIASIQEQISALQDLPQTAEVLNSIAAYRRQAISVTAQIAAAEAAATTGAGITSAQIAANAVQLTDVAPGQRYAVVLYLTRNGYLTPASAPVGFVTDATTITAQFKGLPIGPPNVIARIVALSAANAGVGGPFYFIPQAVNTTATAGLSAGATITASATVVSDNTSTETAVLTLSDTVLLAGINVSTTGSNLQQQRELGECVKCVQFQGRTFFMGERTKVDALWNMTFDGGSVAGFPAGWTNEAGSLSVSLIASPIFGQSLSIANATGGTINPTGTGLGAISSIVQSAYQNFAKRAIIQPQNPYSVRVTAWLGAPQAQGSLVIELYSASAAQNWSFSVPFSSLGTTPAEFSGTLGNPLWEEVPADLTVRVYPSNIAAGATVNLDRIELFPANQPVYTSQIAASYAGNTEAVDAVTGVIDISNFTTDPITNIFRFLDSLYITTATRTFGVQTSTDEPAFWGVREISNRVGCIGPLAFDAGEEYSLVASRYGVYLFDGGNHVKISQDIQKLWSLLYMPSAAGIWIKNDITAQRVYVGVPVTAPNYWMPNLAESAAPALPNAILMCSYLTAPTGAAVAADTPVTVSMFTGSLLFRDERRKWTSWQIASPFGEFISRADGSAPFWLCGTSNSSVFLLDSAARTDNGAVIHERYVTYDFADEEHEDSLRLGSARKAYGYASVLVEGSGKFTCTTYPETTAYPYPSTQPAFALSNPATADTGIPLNDVGNRLFFDFAVDGTAGSWYSLNEMIVAVAPARLPVVN